MKLPKVPLAKEFRSFRRINDELGEVVGEGRQASEIVAVVEELYDRIAVLDLQGVPERSEFRWRLADQTVRSRLHITRDGRLVPGTPEEDFPDRH